jgi:Cu-Zn family superoxide dismutase
MYKLFFSAVLIYIFSGCQPRSSEDAQGDQDTLDTGASGEVAEAVAELSPTQGSNVKGTVTFKKDGNGIMVTADIEGLKPGTHGFHIHEKGDCSAPDGSSAGPHFNPANKHHGAPGDTARHVGDLGNLEADRDGKAHLEMLDTLLTFEGANSIIGRAVIVHEKADDFKTQPTGNAGGRLACGVIEEK